MTTQSADLQLSVSCVKFNEHKIELSYNVKGKPVARLYKHITVGKNKGEYKLLKGYYFADETRREVWVKEQIATINKRVVFHATQKEAKKDAISSHPFKVGDALYASWGYDQTNIDFFEIIEVLPRSVKIRPIGEIYVNGSEGFMCERVKPDMGNYTGEAITRIVKAFIQSNGNPYYLISNGRHSLSLYDNGESGVYQSHYA